MITWDELILYSSCTSSKFQCIKDTALLNHEIGCVIRAGCVISFVQSHEIIARFGEREAVTDLM